VRRRPRPDTSPAAAPDRKDVAGGARAGPATAPPSPPRRVLRPSHNAAGCALAGPGRRSGVRRQRSGSSTRHRRDSRPRPARSTDRRAQPATNTPATRDPPTRAKHRRHEASGPHSARRSTSRFPPTRTAQVPAPHREWGPCSDCGHQLIQIRGPLRDGGDRSAVVAAWRTWLVGPEPDRPELGCRPSRLASLTSPSNVSPDVSVTRNTTAPAMSRLVGSASPMNRQPPAT